MSYVSPTINSITAPIGLDAPIESLRIALDALPWLSKSFGRAFPFRDGRANIPKCYTEKGEYINVLPNDTLFIDSVAASSFIALKGPEEYEQFNKFSGSEKRATLSIIIWGNLKLIDGSKDYIFIEELKNDVEKIVKANQYVFEILEWVDEKADDVFDGYTLNDNECLMYPYAGFRLDVTVFYPETC